MFEAILIAVGIALAVAAVLSTPLIWLRIRSQINRTVWRLYIYRSTVVAIAAIAWVTIEIVSSPTSGGTDAGGMSPIGDISGEILIVAFTGLVAIFVLGISIVVGLSYRSRVVSKNRDVLELGR